MKADVARARAQRFVKHAAIKMLVHAGRPKAKAMKRRLAAWLKTLDLTDST